MKVEKPQNGLVLAILYRSKTPQNGAHMTTFWGAVSKFVHSIPGIWAERHRQFQSALEKP